MMTAIEVFKNTPLTTEDRYIYQGERVVAAVYREYPEENRQPGESWMAMRNRTQPERDKLRVEMLARAKLFAAAPDMLAALQMAKHIVMENGTHDELDQVLSAIEKAGVPA
jgi:hypothetical protein